ncbi:MAG: hypothetical protein ACFFAN_07905 [Promethearchaeota archaeon]
MILEKGKKNIENIIEYYKRIRESLSGLSEILKINFQKNNIYYQLGIDNLKALNENILELLKHSYSPREVRIKLRELEFDEFEAKKTLIL